MLDFVLRIAF